MKRAIYSGLVVLSLLIFEAISESVASPVEHRGAQSSMSDREASCRTVLANVAHLDPGNFRKIEALLKLGDVLREQEKSNEAEGLYRQALAGCKAAFGDDDPNTAAVESTLAILLGQLGRYSEAERLLRHSSAIYAETLRTQPTQFATVLTNLAGVLLEEHRYEEADPPKGSSCSPRPQGRERRGTDLCSQ
jgi:tetratricopeptide (TPR) repeat protein